MNFGVCNAEEFNDDEFGFLKVFQIIRMNDIVIIWKFTDCSFVEIFDDFAK